MRFTGRRGGLLALLLIQLFPQYLAAVALYLMFTEIGEAVPAMGLNTLLGYILVLCGNSLGQVWLIKGFFDTLPMSLDEAAKVDGASHVQTFFRIILPLVTPILAVCSLLVFVVGHRRVPAGLDLPDRRQQEDARHRSLRPDRR